jgi:hypothetical protein
MKGYSRIRVPRPRAVRNRLPALRSPRVNGLGILPRSWVNTHVNCGIESVLNLRSDERDLQHGVIAALLAHVEQHVSSVGGNLLRVRIVGRGLLDLAKEVLLDVELADVRDGSALDRVVGEDFGAVMDDGYGNGQWHSERSRGGRRTVEMVGAANVVARDHGDEGGSAVGASLL